MKDASMTMSAQWLTTAGTHRAQMQSKLIHSVTLTDSACLNILKTMKRSLDGSTLLDLLTYRT